MSPPRGRIILTHICRACLGRIGFRPSRDRNDSPMCLATQAHAHNHFSRRAGVTRLIFIRCPPGLVLFFPFRPIGARISFDIYERFDQTITMLFCWCSERRRRAFEETYNSQCCEDRCLDVAMHRRSPFSCFAIPQRYYSGRFVVQFSQPGETRWQIGDRLWDIPTIGRATCGAMKFGLCRGGVGFWNPF